MSVLLKFPAFFPMNWLKGFVLKSIQRKRQKVLFVLKRYKSTSTAATTHRREPNADGREIPRLRTAAPLLPGSLHRVFTAKRRRRLRIPIGCLQQRNFCASANGYHEIAWLLKLPDLPPPGKQLLREQWQLMH
ncbi:hypothetical protein [Pseudanabaena sp. PCC 6802]|uniref:hypothetical protein n=1 Tax=Pseudanabaena sp. PCC 6802 TaxID=118173 RepID=UPI00036CDAB8|nr:hypothetical protein [Pseudanabaena sp. PCC 6802]